MEYVNMDFTLKKVIHSQDKELQIVQPDFSYVVLEEEGHDEGRKTSVITLQTNSFLRGLLENSSKEILVVSGNLESEYATLGAGAYLRIPKGSHVQFKATEKTVVFVKENAGILSSEQIFIKPFSNHWFPGHGNLKVMELHHLPHDTAALVHWPAGTRFAPHRHWGGEEIFVMKGEFIDEHGRYPAGTWIRSPHLSTHFPYVEVDTTIMVKIGHLG